MTILSMTVAAAPALALIVAPATAQQPAAAYDELVAAVKAGKTDVDFLALRQAYAASPVYDPYGSQLGSLQRDMFEAYRREDCPAAQLRAEGILAISFIHADAHFVASLC